MLRRHLAETVGVAGLLGAAIGLERQWHQGMAGFGQCGYRNTSRLRENNHFCPAIG
jgi:hypothetical protein